jgi:cytochrome bd-type quinol oxidase subunit 1
MPSPSEPLIDERFEELAALLRDTRPRPPERLREHVRELALTPVVERPARRFARFDLRRLVPLATALLVVAALAGGIGVLASRTSSTTSGDEAASGRPETAAAFESLERAPGTAQRDAAGSAPAQEQEPGAATLPPARGRAQEYKAELSVRVDGVDELSETTGEAMQITRSLGGFIVSATYDAPGDAEGDSVLVVRVPVGRIQDAIVRFSELGTILAQRISVADLQGQLNRQEDAIAALRRTIVRLETQLEDTTLSPETRERLRLQLLEARRSLSAREGANAQTKRRAATARVALTLTTREEAAEPAPPPDENGFGGTLRDALEVLAAVLTWSLATLIVASPLLVLVVLTLILLRLRRRAEERRLLERPAS